MSGLDLGLGDIIKYAAPVVGGLLGGLTAGEPQTTTQTQVLGPEAKAKADKLLELGNSVANLPNIAYTGDRVAGLSPDTLAGIAATRKMQGSTDGLYKTAADNLATSAKPISSTIDPYLKAATAGDPLGQASPWFDKAGRALDAAQPGIDAAAKSPTALATGSPLINEAADTNSLDAASPYIAEAQGKSALGSAQSYLDSARSKSALGSAQPYLASASQTFPGAVSAYMSPYTSSVVDEIERLGKRNLEENTIPAVRDAFTGAGQLSGTREGEYTARALRDANADILGKQAQALESGYSTAGTLFNNDANRAAGLAGTAGSLAGADATRDVSMAQTAGGLAGTDASRDVNLASLAANTASADAARKLSAGTSLGSQATADQAAALARAGLTGSLSSADASRIVDMGKTAAASADSVANRALNAGALSLNAGSTDANNAARAGTATGNLAGQQQTAGYNDAAALLKTGGIEQTQLQNELDVPYQDYQQAKTWPMTTATTAANILNGVPSGSTTTTTAPGSSALGGAIAGAAGGYGLAQQYASPTGSAPTTPSGYTSTGTQVSPSSWNVPYAKGGPVRGAPKPKPAMTAEHAMAMAKAMHRMMGEHHMRLAS